MRPRTLAEVAGRTIADRDWNHHLNEFLDVFYAADGDKVCQASLILEEPEFVDIAHADATIGGAGEHLARRWNLPIPRWVRHPERYLDVPFFFPGDRAMKHFLMVASPASFRTRLIFTGPDPLHRARFPKDRGRVQFVGSLPS